MGSTPQPGLPFPGDSLYTHIATPPNTWSEKRASAPTPRFQKGCFVTEPDGRMYSMYYVDAEDGKSKRVKKFIGNLHLMSERAGRSEHARVMETVNSARSCQGPVYRGQTFEDAVEIEAAGRGRQGRGQPFANVNATFVFTFFPDSSNWHRKRWALAKSRSLLLTSVKLSHENQPSTS